MAGRTSDTATLAVMQAEKAFEESRSNNILARRTVQLAGGAAREDDDEHNKAERSIHRLLDLSELVR